MMLTDLMGIVFPALAAFSALDSPATEANKEDLAHWLTYFVIFAALTTIEYFQNVLLYLSLFSRFYNDAFHSSCSN